MVELLFVNMHELSILYVTLGCSRSISLFVLHIRMTIKGIYEAPAHDSNAVFE